MPRFSLIVATYGRTDELSILLKSLESQEFKDFELIVVDQNPDDRLVPILAGWTSAVLERSIQVDHPPKLLHLRCAPGVSKARNLGLAHSEGEILAFPDDDCWYYPDTLRKVDSWFKKSPDYGILCLGCRDEQGNKSGNHWFQTECDLAWINIFRTSGTCCYFVCRPPANVPLLFDEMLGPGAGTPFGCGEDTDFLLTLMSHGVRGRFYSLFHVGHPSRRVFVDTKRAASYGGGFGRVLAKHSNPWLCAAFLLFDFGRAALRVLTGDITIGKRLMAHGRAMMRAYIST